MKLVQGMSDESLLGLPRMKDPVKLGAMQIMNHVALYAVYTNPNLAAIIAFRMVEVTVKYGLCAISAAAFVLFGVIVSRCVGSSNELVGASTSLLLNFTHPKSFMFRSYL